MAERCRDWRQTRELWQNTENSDDVTALDFHPTRPSVLLAGGADGVVSIFDTMIAEEDDSLIQGFDHGPVFKAGFLGRERIYALSSDQQLTIHPVSTSGDEDDPLPTIIGDVRPIVQCEYVVDMLKSGDDYVIATGTNIQYVKQKYFPSYWMLIGWCRESRLDLVKIDHALDLERAPCLDLSTRHVLAPAHGEEVVRSVYVDSTVCWTEVVVSTVNVGQSGVIFTAGEDGYIRAFGQSQIMSSSGTTKGTKVKKSGDGRYKPY